MFFYMNDHPPTWSPTQLIFPQIYISVPPTRINESNSPIFGNDDFLPGRAECGFKTSQASKASQGVAKISDLFKDYQSFRSFEELKATYKIPSKQFFKYLQLRSFILARQSNNLKIPPLSSLEDFTMRFSDSKGKLSLFLDPV